MIVDVMFKTNKMIVLINVIFSSFGVIIAPAYSRVRYRISNFRPSIRSLVRQHLLRSLVFSTSVIAASLKPCIVIVLDIPFKHAP